MPILGSTEHRHAAELGQHPLQQREAVASFHLTALWKQTVIGNFWATAHQLRSTGSRSLPYLPDLDVISQAIKQPKQPNVML